MSEQTTAEGRAAPRASIYLAATLRMGSSSSPVKIRNLSSTGALVEAAVAPDPGSLVQMVRGELVADGAIVWTAEGRFGLNFTGTVDVQQWLAPIRNGEQQRVDHAVQLVKAGVVPLPVPHSPGSNNAVKQVDLAEQLADDLCCASALLESLGNELACDSEVVARHGIKLQNLDIALQMLAAIGKLVRGSAPDVPSSKSKLSDLRRSANQALDQSETNS